MSLRRIALVAVVAVGVALLTATMWLLVDNQSVDISASDYNYGHPAGMVECTIAPYDAGFNDNHEPPGGEHRGAYSDEVAGDCYTVNMQRFHAASGAGLVGVAMLGVAIWCRRSRSAHRHDRNRGMSGWPSRAVIE